MPFHYLSRQQIEEQSPSRRDGLSVVQESRRRRQLVKFIRGSTQRLKL
jgi:hypothetical protein